MIGRRLIEGISNGNIYVYSLKNSLGESDETKLGYSVSIRLGNFDGIDDNLIDSSGLGKDEGYAVGALDGMEIGLLNRVVDGIFVGALLGGSLQISDGWRYRLQ